MDEANSIVQFSDLSVATLIALVDRLRATETPDQFLCREIELDEAYLQADAEARLAEDRSAEHKSLDEAQQIRALVISAHDFVGESNIAAAVQELNRVIEIKLGL